MLTIILSVLLLMLSLLPVCRFGYPLPLALWRFSFLAVKRGWAERAVEKTTGSLNTLLPSRQMHVCLSLYHSRHGCHFEI
jgi:hypothetical protein